MPSRQPPSRSSLASKAHKYRLLTKILSWLDRYLSLPLPPKPTHHFTIKSTISKTPDSIDLYFFTARSEPLPKQHANHRTPPRPVLINFHGGGFSIGHPIDDARWLGTVLKTYADAILVSVGYRLAPEFPFPIAIEDGVDAILWLSTHAEEYNLDPGQFVLCGDSAGGNLAFTVPLRLHEELSREQQQPVPERLRPKFTGIIAFYPTLDSTKSRSERDASNPIAAKKSKIPQSALKFFDDSYLLRENLPRKTGPGPDVGDVDLSHPYVSPGLAPTPLLLEALPSKVAIYTCGWDQLLVEGDMFRERLRKLVREGEGGMERVGGMVIEDVIHGFDKAADFGSGNRKRGRMYADAVGELGWMWDSPRIDVD